MSHAAQTVGELRAVWESIAELCPGMDEDQWRSPSGCPGWDIGDIVAHLVGTERSLGGEHPPAAPDSFPEYVRNPIGEFNERWVAHLRSASRVELLAQFREVTSRRLATLSALSPEEWEAPAITPAGPGTYLFFMRIRVFDSWVHEQDIRWVLGKPGGLEGSWVETGLGVPRATLPKLLARGVRAPAGTVVEWVLAGKPEQRWRVAVRDRRGVEVDGEAAEPAVRLRCRVDDFVFRVCGRVDPASGSPLGVIRVDGDQGLGERLVEGLPLLM